MTLTDSALRRALLASFCATALSVPLAAQLDRYELGHRLRLLEATAAESSVPRQNITDDIDAALRGFFGLDLPAAARALDAARLTLGQSADAAPSPALRYAAALQLVASAQLVAANTDALTFTFDLLYDPTPDQPAPASEQNTAQQPDPPHCTAELNLGTWHTSVDLSALPATVTLPADAVLPGDHTLHWQIRAADRVLLRRARTVSVAADLDARLTALEAAARTIARRPTTTEQATLRALFRTCRSMTRRRQTETDLPGARLLAEAEALVTTLEADAEYYTAARSGQFWLHVVDADKDLTACRIEIPPGLDPARPAPILFALHGAGGSENLWFDGEGGLTPRMCRERGWILVAPRCSPMGGTPLPQLLAALAARYPIDRDRVFVAGHSMGAMQAVAHVARDPAHFRAVAALGGGGRVPTSGDRIQPAFWVACGTRDFAFRQAKALHRALEQRGARSEFAPFEHVGHVLILQDATEPMFRFFDQHAR